MLPNCGANTHWLVWSAYGLPTTTFPTELCITYPEMLVPIHARLTIMEGPKKFRFMPKCCIFGHIFWTTSAGWPNKGPKDTNFCLVLAYIKKQKIASWGLVKRGPQIWLEDLCLEHIDTRTDYPFQHSYLSNTVFPKLLWAVTQIKIMIVLLPSLFCVIKIIIQKNIVLFLLYPPKNCILPLAGNLLPVWEPLI